MNTCHQNWVFLGDSLTEGVGSRRVSYVTELVAMLRRREEYNAASDRRSIHEFRLRRVDPESFNRFVRVNMAGTWTADEAGSTSSLWIWNFAGEGTTITNDFDWLPLIRNLHPERVFVFRGSLESVVRPYTLSTGAWPWWIPSAWRGYASMDPRCYFSTTWWRYAKQVVVDATKQRIRQKLLHRRRGCTLLEETDFSNQARNLFDSLIPNTTHLHVLGLLPIAESQFPGSGEQFRRINAILCAAAKDSCATFVDWRTALEGANRGPNTYFFRDGFHPNESGAQALAQKLMELIDEEADAQMS